MNLTELKDWIKSSKFVESSGYESDSNWYETTIYEREEQFFSLGYCNGHPSEKWDGKGFIRDVYEPKIVRKASWMEYRHEWVNA